MSLGVMQPWTEEITLMQQSVLISAIRGPDGLANMTPAKRLLKWLRRCVLRSALDGTIHPNPWTPSKGKYTGPSMPQVEPWEYTMNQLVEDYLDECDQSPFHFHMHLIHATEVLGYKHPDPRIRTWWNQVYNRLVNALHMRPEPEVDMDRRLGDSRDGWKGAESKLPCSPHEANIFLFDPQGINQRYRIHEGCVGAVWQEVEHFTQLRQGVLIWVTESDGITPVYNRLKTPYYRAQSNVYPIEQGAAMWLAINVIPVTQGWVDEWTR